MAALKELLADPTLAKEFFSQATVEEAQAFLKGKGIDISVEDIQKFVAEIKDDKDGELSADDLMNVVGGLVRTPEKPDPRKKGIWF